MFRQKFGTAMGSPVSPLVANMFTEHSEEKLLATLPKELKPKLWKRYVDDILEVARKGSVEELRNLWINWMSLAVSCLCMKWNKMASYLF